MKIDRVKVTIDFVALVIAALIAVSIGALAPVYQVSPAVMVAAGALALYLSRTLVGYVASLPVGTGGATDLAQVMALVHNAAGFLSTNQNAQATAVLAKLDQLIAVGTVEKPVEEPPLAQLGTEPAAPTTGPPAVAN